MIRRILVCGATAAMAAAAGGAAADLYLWKDPATGSVKIYSYPPPWYGNPELEKRSPKVERVPERQRVPVVEPDAAPTAPAAKPSPAKPGVPPPPPGMGGAVGALAPALLAPLEAQRKRLLEIFSALPARPDFDRAGQGMQQQLEAYQAVSAEMDRIDPKGAEARRADSRTLIERLRDGLRAQTGAQPQR